MKVEYIIKNNNEIFFYGTIDDDDMRSNLKIIPIKGYHKGYLEQWEFIKDKILEEVKKLGKEIIISGHSLGGGIARIAITELANQFKDINFILKTYGTPRSYTLDHKIKLERNNIIKIEEYINRGDLIPRLPPFFPFFWLYGADRRHRIVKGKCNFNFQKSHNSYEY